MPLCENEYICPFLYSRLKSSVNDASSRCYELLLGDSVETWFLSGQSDAAGLPGYEHRHGAQLKASCFLWWVGQAHTEWWLWLGQGRLVVSEAWGDSAPVRRLQGAWPGGRGWGWRPSPWLVCSLCLLISEQGALCISTDNAVIPPLPTQLSYS